MSYPLHTTGTAYVAGQHLVTLPKSDTDGYRVMQNFGPYQMLKKVFKTLPAAIKRAEQLDTNR